MTLSPPAEVPASTPLLEEEIGREKKEYCQKGSIPTEFGGSNDDSIDWDNASFDDWRIVKTLVDTCVLPHIVKRITCTNLDQQVGHQLITNVEMINAEKAKVSKAVDETQEYKAEGYIRESVHRASNLDGANLDSSDKLKVYRAPPLPDLLKERTLFNLEMDAQAAKMLTKGLFTRKRKEKA
ncbi:hypothetical protein COCNU_scaffold002905G000010 [Cocos nucifera]|nr:hypothetical protein [Cocos nucifera]